MSVFSKIIAGDIPGKFVWADADCVAFATIEPAAPGHVLVVPRVEVDRFSDLPSALFAHLGEVAQIIARAQEVAFEVPRSIVMILGFDVPHTHVHVIPAVPETLQVLGKERPAPEADITAAMERLRAELHAQGHGEFVPADMHTL